MSWVVWKQKKNDTSIKNLPELESDILGKFNTREEATEKGKFLRCLLGGIDSRDFWIHWDYLNDR